MPAFLQPDPWLVAFLLVVKFWAAPVLCLLALFRLIAGGWAARLWALLALVAGGIACLAVYAPVIDQLIPGPDLQMSDIWRQSAQVQAHWGGKTLVIATSALLWLSAFGGRGRWIDVLHGLAVLGFLGIWGYTLTL